VGLGINIQFEPAVYALAAHAVGAERVLHGKRLIASRTTKRPDLKISDDEGADPQCGHDEREWG
jgi:hypothetical protein